MKDALPFDRVGEYANCIPVYGTVNLRLLIIFVKALCALKTYDQSPGQHVRIRV